MANVREVAAVFSSRILIDSYLTFRAFIHFEFIFVYGVRKWSSFILLHVTVQFSWHHLLKKLSFSHWIFFPALSKINWQYSCEFISGFSILFYWSMCLFLCQYHIALITTALWFNLKSGIVMPSALLFFFKIALAIQDLCWFHTNFRMVCSISLKNAGGIS